HLVEFSLEWYPDATNDIMTLFQVHIDPAAESWKVGMRMVGDLAPNALFPMIFSNAPDTLFIVTWTPTVKDLSALRERILGLEAVRRAVPHIIFSGNTFDTWRDRLLSEKAGIRSSRKGPDPGEGQLR
ncbi:MAG TPA: hypothetical protein VMS79_02835, partial [Methanomassiliicoccales archaeon]|nr:hypothetical protein [Methanomassiliicoccales archaeon]